MKVWELMNELGKAKANAEVFVGMEATLNAMIERVTDYGEAFIITGGDAEMIDSEGNEMGKLSYHADVETD